MAWKQQDLPIRRLYAAAARRARGAEVRAPKSPAGEKARRQKEALAEIKLASGCADCPPGTTWEAICLDFDHRPGEIKAFTIGNRGGTLKWERILEEVAKCDIVCANHHRIRTAQRGYVRVGVRGQSDPERGPLADHENTQAQGAESGRTKRAS